MTRLQSVGALLELHLHRWRGVCTRRVPRGVAPARSRPPLFGPGTHGTSMTHAESFEINQTRARVPQIQEPRPKL